MITDKNNTARPFIGKCAFCGDGMLRFWCIDRKLVALCDECELQWDNVRAVAEVPESSATGTFDESVIGTDHHPATHDEIVAAGFDDVIAGYSD